jgi:hypothetical protein
MHINLTELNNLEERWNDLVNLSLGQSPISGQVFQSIIRDTFRVLNFYDKAETISKTLAQILILMSEFAAYSLMSDDDQGFNPIIMREITVCLLWDFARGFQSSGLSYPILQISDEYYFNMNHINVETNDLLTLQFNDEYPLPF